MRTYAKKMHGLVLAAAIAVAMGVCLVLLPQVRLMPSRKRL
jgi:hypothetical protein